MGQRSRCHENCRMMTEIQRREIKGKCEALASILRLIPANFPTELQHGSLEVNTIFVIFYVF